MSIVDKIESYYCDKIQQHFPDYKIHGWESEEAQLSRFKVLYDSVRLSGKSLLDVGCGAGSLVRYLSDHRVKVSYVGVDVLKPMVMLAKQRYPQALFLHQNIFSDNPFPNNAFDVVFASGIFNLDLGNNEAFLQQAVALFGNLATQTILFNCLSVHSNDKEEGYSYIDPKSIPFILKKSGIRMKNYRLIDNYLQNDFTVIIELDKKDEDFL